MSRTLITGAGGMLGRDLVDAFAGGPVTAAGRDDLDITDADAVHRAVRGCDLVVNAAAYTAVDAAEEHEEEAYRVNALGAENLAIATRENGARLVQLSTDYVFDGRAAGPYPEDAPVNPVSAYGRTKAAGERLARAAHPEGTLIVRTAWLYGAHGRNFAHTMLRLAATRATVEVVDDQHGQPTWTADLAGQIVRLVDTGTAAGVFHATSSGETTWCGFAKAVFAEAGLDPDRVLPTDSTAFPRPAARPANSVLGHDAWGRIGLEPIRDWHEALEAAATRGVLAS